MHPRDNSRMERMDGVKIRRATLMDLPLLPISPCRGARDGLHRCSGAGLNDRGPRTQPSRRHSGGPLARLVSGARRLWRHRRCPMGARSTRSRRAAPGFTASTSSPRSAAAVSASGLPRPWWPGAANTFRCVYFTCMPAKKAARCIGRSASRPLAKCDSNCKLSWWRIAVRPSRLKRDDLRSHPEQREAGAEPKRQAYFGLNEKFEIATESLPGSKNPNFPVEKGRPGSSQVSKTVHCEPS